MELKSMRCPNCNGPVKQIGEGRFVCMSCDTTFMADYDREDVEYAKIRQQTEREKRQFEQQKIDQVRRTQQAKKASGKIVAVVLISFFVLYLAINVIAVLIFGIVKSRQDQYSNSKARQESRQQQREAEEKQKEESRQRAQEERESKEAAERAAILASYQVTTEDLLADEFFAKNAAASLRNKLDTNSKLYWTNWVWNEEPEYMESYLLIAKDDNEKTHNKIISIYKVHWDKDYGEGEVEKYVMYDCTCLTNVSLNTDGTIKSDYSAVDATNHSEIVVNQMFSGYLDHDQLIREEIYGHSEYDYYEFQFPVASGDETIK